MRKTIAATFIAASVFTGTLVAATEVSATPIACENRGHNHWERNGKAEDDRYHISRGERVTCHDENKSDKPVTSDKKTSTDKKDNGKSRYCRKRWFC